MPRCLPLGLTSLLLLACVAAGADDNWPRFRGPNGTGVSNDKNIPLQWTEKDVLWKTPIPGLGNGSPIVWGDKVFLQSSAENGSKRMLMCLSVSEGKVLWTKDMPGNAVKFRADSSYANSTPCTDGERVYALFWDGQKETVYAFDFAGKQVWKHDLGVFTSQHGAGTSPIVHEGKVFLNHDMDGKASVIALDAKTGQVAWEKARKHFRTSYSTPFLREKTDEGSELIVASTAGITAYNPQTGQENWNWTWPFSGMALRTVGAAMIHQGMAFGISGDGSGARCMVGVKLGGTGELPKESLTWRIDKGETPYVPCLVAQGDYVFGIHDGNNYGTGVCLNAKTGEIVWKQERLCAKIYSSPLLINGHIYAVDSEGEVKVYPASPTFKEPLTSSIGEAAEATPAVSNGKLFIRGRNHLFCIGKK